MSQLRLYTDEDSMRRALVRELRAHGVDVTTAREAGMIKRADEEHLDYATSLGRALYSFNIGDYCRIHGDYLARGKAHAGIILAPQPQFSVGEQLRRLLKLIAGKTAEEMRDQLIFLSN